MDNKKKLKKIILVSATVCLSVLLIIGIIATVSLLVLNKVSQNDNTEPTVSYQFFLPDREANILEDEDYLQKDLIIKYSNGVETFPLAEKNSAEFGNGAAFFLEYFDALIGGEEDKMNSLYTDEYVSVHGKEDDFTMQRAYDMNVLYLGEKSTENSSYDVAYEYVVNYKIMRNDGTFRRDIPSDASRAQLFYIVNTDDGYKLLDIKYYINKEE